MQRAVRNRAAGLERRLYHWLNFIRRIASMYRPLHTLRLALPGTPRVDRAHVDRTLSQVYKWPCGCCGTGQDVESLRFSSCLDHHELLSEAPLMRSSF
jgi:hypothetical protein